MHRYGPTETARLMDQKTMYKAGPVKTYNLNDELETQVAFQLGILIRTNRLNTKAECDERREAINQIILACVKELDKEAANGQQPE